MNSEPKSFASLTSGLLARKGAARPAMRPQGFGQLGAGLEDLGWNDMGFEPPRPAAAPVRDAGHDAFGGAVAEPAVRMPLGLTPISSPVHDQQAEIAGRLGRPMLDPEDEEEAVDRVAPAPVMAKVVPIASAPSRPTVARAAPGSKGKAAFTLRLDPARHLKLRLACAVLGRSAQQLVSAALDDFLASVPELDSLAASAPDPSRLSSRKG